MEQKGKDVEAILSDPKRAILHMSIPLFFSFLVGSLQMFIDRVWCSGLGPDELSAITIGGPAYRIIISIGLAVGVGVSAAIARSLGSEDKGKADKLASQGVMITAAISVITMVAMYFFCEPIVAISGNGNNVDITMEYMMPYILCTIPLVYNGLIIGMVRAEGAAKKSTMLSITASIINMVLDPIMIYGLDLGVKGAAWATCISFIIATLLGISLYVRNRMYINVNLKGFRFDKKLQWEFGVITIPYAIEVVLMCLMIAPEQGFVASCGGSDGLVIYVSAFNYVDLVMIPTSAIAASLIPVMSAQLGQKSIEKVKGSLKYSIKLVVAIEAVAGLFLFIFADQLISLYTYAESMAPLHDEMVLALRIYSIAPVTNAILHMGSATIKALRKAALSTVLSFTREGIFLLFYWFAAQISMEAIYWSLDATNLLMMTVVMIVTMYVIRVEARKMAASTG